MVLALQPIIDERDQGDIRYCVAFFRDNTTSTPETPYVVLLCDEVESATSCLGDNLDRETARTLALASADTYAAILSYRPDDNPRASGE